MNIKSAEFEISNTDVKKRPEGDKPEYANIGRSNERKSPLINMLTNKKKKKKTSSTPGKTLLINHFLINDAWYIVDLPGYGYAQRGKESREKLKHIIQSYILGRAQMTNLFVLVDSRHKPQKIDLEFMQWLGENEVPFSIVFTKMDKLGKEAGQRNVEAYKAQLLEQWEELPPLFITSSQDRRRRHELLNYLEEINRQIAEQSKILPFSWHFYDSHLSLL